jgi:hypothetical protein
MKQVYARCAMCRRLALKSSLKRGPDGALVGPKCMQRAIAAQHDEETRSDRTSRS